MSGTVWLVGAGPGDPDLLTLRAARVLNEADVVLVDRLVHRCVLAHVRRGAEVIDVGKEGGHRCIAQEEINRMLIARAREGLAVVRLKGGDPFVFGRGAEEAEALIEAGIEWEVVPGISSGIAAAAYAGIPLLHRDHASSVAFVSGHAGRRSAALDCGADTLVIFMCAATIREIARELVLGGRRAETPVALIRSGTLETQEVWTGTLGELLKTRSQFGTPLLAIVGPVAALSDRLHWFGAAARKLAADTSDAPDAPARAGA
jgi:uroporphyrin-III C-methyltransferase